MIKPTFHVSRVLQYVRLTRPVFLLGGVLYYRLGVQIAIGEGHTVNWAIYWVGQTIVTAIQLAAQYANEYFDQEVDAINAPRRTWLTGGSGVLQAEQIPAVIANNLAKGFSLLSIALITVFLFENPIPACIAVVALIGAWMYSAAPVRLASRGVGEIVSSVIVCALVPGFGCLLQTNGQIPKQLILLSPLLLFHFAMLIVFNMPDRAGDAIAGKRTLVVRFGLFPAALIHFASIICGWALITGFFSIQVHPTILILSFVLSILYSTAIIIYSLSNPAHLPHSLATMGAIIHFVWMSFVVFFFIIQSQ